jgi:hypothetical protein
MTTSTRTRPAGVTAYYLGRPAAFWLTALAPRRPARAVGWAPQGTQACRSNVLCTWRSSIVV